MKFLIENTWTMYLFAAAAALLIFNSFRLAFKAEKTMDGAYLYFYSGAFCFFILCIPPYWFDGWMNALYVVPCGLMSFYLFNKGNYNKRKHLFFREVARMLENRKTLSISKVLSENDVPEELVEDFIMQMIDYKLINADYDTEKKSLANKDFHKSP